MSIKFVCAKSMGATDPMRSGNRQEAIGNSKAKVFGFVLCALLFALCVSAQAQQAKKVPRIGYLSGARPTGDAERSQGIKLALREIGYREGENIAFEFRYAQEKIDRLPELAAELVRTKVDIIVAAGGRAVIQAPMNATTTIPIVMSGQGPDPVEAGFVKSLARPGGNVTGLTTLLVGLGDKRLELLKEAVPKIVRVAVPYVPGNQTHSLELKEVQTAAHPLGVTIQTFEVRGVEDFDRLFAAMRKQRPDALQLLGGPVMRAYEKRIVDFALKTHLPSAFTRIEAVNIGGLLYYGDDVANSYRRVAYYVDRILKGAKPADLPVEQPTKFELIINLKTAKQIGLTIPPTVMARADRVIR
ncbi:MAG TPA: ABC transporter substrate-binding protein [Candidatus Binatia bacterium]|nr:ABC transporter substrate-binding protein [Candidatus Binatia bacterium]